MTDIDARATAARMEFERTVARMEKVDPATSGQARLQGLALARGLRGKRLTPQEYAAELESLTEGLRRILGQAQPVPS